MISQLSLFENGSVLVLTWMDGSEVICMYWYLTMSFISYMMLLLVKKNERCSYMFLLFNIKAYIFLIQPKTVSLLNGNAMSIINRH